MKAFVFVNDNGAAYCRYAKNEIPAQFVYGVSKTGKKWDFEVKVGEGRLFKDLVSFWKFKPDLFFMPFLKRKTMLYFILAKIFMFPTKFAGWMHLDVFSPPGSRLKRMIHSLLLPFLQLYVKRIDAIFFLSDKERNASFQFGFFYSFLRQRTSQMRVREQFLRELNLFLDFRNFFFCSYSFIPHVSLFFIIDQL